jgi:hypothetical protein
MEDNKVMDCKNNYTSIIEFKKSFDSDKGIKVCTSCTYFESDNGIYTCKLFNNIERRYSYENK